MKLGQALTAGVYGFGLGLARVMKNTKNSDKANWPQWMKDLNGYKDKPTADVVAKSDSAPIPAETPKATPENPFPAVTNSSQTPPPSQDDMLKDQNSGLQDTSFPDDGKSSDVVATPLQDQNMNEYEQASTDLGMGPSAANMEEMPSMATMA